MEQNYYELSWEDVEVGARNILNQIKEKGIKIGTIVPVLRGGAPLGSLLSNNMDVDIAYMHVRRSKSNETNAILGEPVLKGITNEEGITRKRCFNCR